MPDFVGSFVGSVFWLLVSLGVLVTIHEAGHFFVARYFGVKVLRFSFGFGKPIWSRFGKDGTEYAIAPIPLGGYVSMLGEGGDEEIAPEDRSRTLNAQAIWKRIAIFAAGPAANLLLCLLLLWGMFVVGRPDHSPTIGRTTGIAAASGFQPGDRLLRVNGTDTPTWTEAGFTLVAAVLDREAIPVTVRDASGAERERTLHLERLKGEVDERRAFAATGFIPANVLSVPVVASVDADKPAAGKLQAGDRIVQVDSTRIDAADALVAALGRAGQAGCAAQVTVERAGGRQTFAITPQAMKYPNTDKPYWGMGIALARPPEPAYDAVLRYGPIAAIPASFHEAVRLTRESYAMLGRILTGRASTKTISGPVAMAEMANETVKRGLAWYLTYLALISLSLGIMNLLPIPVLDGGHILYALIEAVKGSPLGPRALLVGQIAGLAMLAGLMGLAFYNDILGLLR